MQFGFHYGILFCKGVEKMKKSCFMVEKNKAYNIASAIFIFVSIVVSIFRKVRISVKGNSFFSAFYILERKGGFYERERKLTKQQFKV